jgi:hypothetical protein
VWSGLAGMGAFLASMRDPLTLDRFAQTMARTPPATPRADLLWIPSVGRMVLAFVLPFASTFAVIPLESFIRSLRIVLGRVAVRLLHVLAFGTRVSGLAVDHVGRGIGNVYDVPIFLPLKLEGAIAGLRMRPRPPLETQAERAGHPSLDA